ncbi:MAG: bifunctional hydroxymethylpyrimidine kinase/phosphomethylpyrimidine kinase [Chloroflexi bacterium]|nr:bifunctional hydroxymethylpyrimidine kinase/phosphomethylpyrimidine kinase [Chloroflexota bacterium]MBU1746537.1 bifunctional hydroxymethylpyrimidine kinase/phosphomethylpyrimidine kinase [Chloroflexota bacterium]
MFTDDLAAWVPRLAGHTVVVLGDVFLDEYLIGRATRLSREAPVPVLELSRRVYLPGGAANPSRNIVALGGHARQAGLVGDDPASARLCALLRESDIDTSALVVDPARPTGTKTRILAEGTLRFPQQMARIDHIDRRAVDEATQSRLVQALEGASDGAHAILVSNYRAGVVSERLIEACRGLARARGLLLAADSQGDLDRLRGFHLVRANQRDTEAALGHALTTEDDFRRAGDQLLGELAAQAVLIGRAAEGMSLCVPGAYYHLPAANRTEVYDVTGAGDTVAAVVTLAVTAGASFLEAAHLANHAAGMVVRKLGNAVPTPGELIHAITYRE